MRELTSDEQAAMDRVAKFIVRFGITVPAVLWLESMRPLAYSGSQFMHILSPAISTFLPVHQWDALAELLEERDGIDALITHIETVDQEAAA